MAQQNNPFYVDPFGGYGQSIVQGLSGLGAVLGDRQRLKQQEAEKQKMLAEAQEIFASNDPNRIAEFSLRAPQFAEQVSQAIKFKNDATKRNMTDSMRRILAGEDPEQVIIERAQMVQEQGGDPIDTLQELDVYRQDPQGYAQQVARSYALLDPQGYTAFQRAIGQSQDDVMFQQGTGPVAGYVFNPKTGQYTAAFPEGQMPTRDTRTATQKDFEYIQELRDRGMNEEADALAVKLKIKQPGSPEVAAAEATFEKENVLSTFDRSLDAIDSILQDPILESNVYWRAITKDLPGTDARAFEGKVRVLQSQAFLNEIEKMKGFGALSEAEGRKVSDAVANLDTLQDNESLKAQIKIAQDIFTQGRERARRKLEVKEREAQKKVKPSGQQDQGGFTDADFAAAAREAGVSVEEFRRIIGQ